MQAYQQFVAQFTDDQIPYVQHGQRLFAQGAQLDVDAPLVYTTTRYGRVDRKGFHPSIAFLDVLAQHTDRKAVVNDKSAWLFICGRNVLKEGILENPADTGPVLVVNQRGEVLGYGDVQGAGITNKLDRGDFLRRER